MFYSSSCYFQGESSASTVPDSCLDVIVKLCLPVIVVLLAIIAYTIIHPPDVAPAVDIKHTSARADDRKHDFPTADDRRQTGHKIERGDEASGTRQSVLEGQMSEGDQGSAKGQRSAGGPKQAEDKKSDESQRSEGGQKSQGAKRSAEEQHIHGGQRSDGSQRNAKDTEDKKEKEAASLEGTGQTPAAPVDERRYVRKPRVWVDDEKVSS